MHLVMRSSTGPKNLLVRDSLCGLPLVYYLIYLPILIIFSLIYHFFLWSNSSSKIVYLTFIILCKYTLLNIFQAFAERSNWSFQSITTYYGHGEAGCRTSTKDTGMDLAEKTRKNTRYWFIIYCQLLYYNGTMSKLKYTVFRIDRLYHVSKTTKLYC